MLADLRPSFSQLVITARRFLFFIVSCSVLHPFISDVFVVTAFVSDVFAAAIAQAARMDFSVAVLALAFQLSSGPGSFDTANGREEDRQQELASQTRQACRAGGKGPGVHNNEVQYQPNNKSPGVQIYRARSEEVCDLHPYQHDASPGVQ